MDSNLIQFPRKPVRELEALTPANEPHDLPDYQGGAEGLPPRRALPVRLLGGLLTGVRYALFLVMYWLRGIIVGLCSIVSVFTLIGFLFAFFLMPEKTAMVWGCGVASFTSFVLMWAYDRILMCLSPDPMMTTL